MIDCIWLWLHLHLIMIAYADDCICCFFQMAQKVFYRWWKLLEAVRDWSISMAIRDREVCSETICCFCPSDIRGHQLWRGTLLKKFLQVTFFSLTFSITFWLFHDFLTFFRWLFWPFSDFLTCTMTFWHFHCDFFKIAYVTFFSKLPLAGCFECWGCRILRGHRLFWCIDYPGHGSLPVFMLKYT